MAATRWASDEDVAIRAPGDFRLLCPADQVVAAGSDGRFEAGDRWTLRSATVDFAAQGVEPGQVVQLLGPEAAYRAPGEMLAVEAVGSGWARLRRRGLAAGRGQPPAPAIGLGGVTFRVATLAPQLAAAEGDLRRRFGLADGAAPADAGGLRDAAVLTALSRRYLDLARDPAGASDPLAAKARRLGAELDEVLARVVVRAPAGSGATTRFHTRLAR